MRIELDVGIKINIEVAGFHFVSVLELADCLLHNRSLLLNRLIYQIAAAYDSFH